ncbi:beta-ketoacyl-[acyl-carrier-protein] synthase family protein [Enterobacter cloacae]|uniref:beta-ketoacyl-[acyl-carrier-protein] synthase family protein n=1 Tax=Enterobacter cloacae TaxID=550 RepID=UPI0013EF9A50|nr:beta-ketoacyl-[acyl-carrier-protein] synthase family protein [Enterobacter cloacae]
MKEHKVVITGMGLMSAGGKNVAEAWDNILRKNHSFSTIAHKPENVASTFYSFIETTDDMFSKLPNSITNILSKHGKLALESCRQAISQAFGENNSPTEHYHPFECGVILGSGWGPFDDISKLTLKYDQMGITHPRSNFITMPSSMTAACAIMYGLQGYQNTIAAACATGNMAIGEAFNAIKMGRAKFMVAGGAESLTSELGIWSIDVLKALSKESEDPARASCPFSLDRSGFVLAEGSAVICLEEYNSAVNRGANILAEITAYASFSDGDHISRPAEDVACRVETITEALKLAKLGANDIGYINAHGTSTPLNDLYETKALKKAFGKQAYNIPVSSTKSYTGHLIGAAGSYETIVCVKALNENTLPSTINLKNPDPQCDLNYLAKDHLYNANVDNVINLSSGFGGHNSALVITRYKKS